jgi:hypothetical protein
MTNQPANQPQTSPDQQKQGAGGPAKQAPGRGDTGRSDPGNGTGGNGAGGNGTGKGDTGAQQPGTQPQNPADLGHDPKPGDIQSGRGTGQIADKSRD